MKINMNSTAVKMALVGVGGALAGAGASFVITRFITRRKAEEEKNEALAAQRELYAKYVDEYKADLEDEEELFDDVTNEKDENFPKEWIEDKGPEEGVDVGAGGQNEKTGVDVGAGGQNEKTGVDLRRKPDTHKTNYSSLVRDLEYSSSPTEEEEFHASPYIISEEAYAEERLTYEKKSCMYYEIDGVLIDQETSMDGFEPMDITRDVLWSNLNEFKKDPELEELYVRNDNQAVDYYIVRCRQPYDSVE